MNHQNPRPGEWGRSEDPNQEYPDDGWGPRYAQPIEINPYYHEARAAHNEARRKHRDEERAKKNARLAEEEREARKFKPAPEMLYALAFGIILLGFGAFVVAIGVPLDYSLFPVGVGGALTIMASAVIAYEHWKK